MLERYTPIKASGLSAQRPNHTRESAPTTIVVIAARRSEDQLDDADVRDRDGEQARAGDREPREPAQRADRVAHATHRDRRSTECEDEPEQIRMHECRHRDRIDRLVASLHGGEKQTHEQEQAGRPRDAAMSALAELELDPATREIDRAWRHAPVIHCRRG
jgi:hypothetical protein